MIVTHCLVRAQASLDLEALRAGDPTPHPDVRMQGQGLATRRDLELSLSTHWPGRALLAHLGGSGRDPGPRRSPGQLQLGTWVHLPAASIRREAGRAGTQISGVSTVVTWEDQISEEGAACPQRVWPPVWQARV